MRLTSLVASTLSAALLTSALVLSSACTGDPNDPMTWVKQLDNLRTQKEALDHLATMDVEKARVAVPALLKLYNETHRPEHLEALARYKDERAKPALLEALEYDDSDYERAVIAANALGDMKATDAVEPLMKAAEKPLPMKSAAKNAKRAALRALVHIGDKRAVPTLMKILNTPADDQDFLFNQNAALGLAEFRDPRSVPALIKGLFMTGRGTNIFQECRLALVRIGTPAVQPLIDTLLGKNPEVQEMAVKYHFDQTPGVVQFKSASVLGDLRDPKAVPILQEKMKDKDVGGEHTAYVIALGLIGDPAGVETLIDTVRDPKAEPTIRISSADALYLTGDPRAAAVLLDLAKNGYMTIGGQKASNLRATAAVDFSRIALGQENYDALKAIAAKETDAQSAFEMAMERMEVAVACQKDLACYGKKLLDPSWVKAEKAAFTLAFSGDDKTSVPLLLAAMKPLSTIGTGRFPVHQAMLFALGRLGTKSCAACLEKLRQQIEKDETAVRLPGGRDLLGEERVTLALIENQEKPVVPRTDVPAVAPSGKGGKGAKAKGGKAKAGKTKGKKH
jgi:HEAT repeat protein